MPHYLLSIKAELTHVKSFRLSDGARFCVDLTSGSETRSDVWLDPAILVEAPGGRSETNLVITFEGASKPATVNVVPCDATSTEYTEANSGQFVAIACFECRGCEVTGYSVQSEWIVVGESGCEFTEEVELNEDWCDYDEEAGVSPEISEFAYKIERYNPPKKGGKKAKGKKK